jgi:hypothetical protein
MLSLSNLTEADVTQAELALVQMLQDEFPSMDLARGRVLRELLIRPAAMFHALNEANMDELRRSMSLYDISQNPALATDDIVTSVLSNLLLTRDTGAEATGQIRIIVTDQVVTPVDSGATFTANGLEFTATQSFVGVTAANNVINTGSRLITARNDGNYEFLIDVEAVATGTEYNVAAGTRFTTTATIPRLVDAIAAGDFSGGRATEDNATLAARAQSGLSPRVLSGRSHIEALLRENFADLSAVSIIGFADSEMLRDKHNLFEMSMGGKADIYARTALSPERVLVNVTATMTDVAVKTLTIALDRDVAAGVYDALAVYRAGATPFQLQGESEPTLLDSLAILSKVWSYNATQTGDEFVPDLETASEAAFTRYRTLVMQFTDGQSTLTAGQTATYQLYLLKMPEIADIQDFVNARDRRGPATDYLVRAPIPAICSVGIKIEARNTGEVDTDAVKNAVVNAVNALGFDVGHLPGSVVIDAAQGQLTSDAVLDLPLTLVATIYMPDGTTQNITGTDELRVPDNLSDPSVSARTVGFFLRTSNVDVSVSELQTPEV